LGFLSLIVVSFHSVQSGAAIIKSNNLGGFPLIHEFSEVVIESLFFIIVVIQNSDIVSTKQSLSVVVLVLLIRLLLLILVSEWIFLVWFNIIILPIKFLY